MSNVRKPTPEEAFNLYCQMGAERSLRRLHQKLDKSQTLKAPALHTLGTWCKKHDWPRRVREYDEQVAAATYQRSVEADADEQWDAAQAFRQAAERAVTRALTEINRIEVSEAGDVRHLVQAAIDLVKTSEVLSGGASDRTETVSRNIPGVEDLEAYLAELDALAAQDENATRH